jgi:hypothetical protein
MKKNSSKNTVGSALSGDKLRKKDTLELSEPEEVDSVSADSDESTLSARVAKVLRKHRKKLITMKK